MKLTLDFLTVLETNSHIGRCQQRDARPGKEQNLSLIGLLWTVMFMFEWDEDRLARTLIANILRLQNI